MDAAGKIIWAKGNFVKIANVAGLTADAQSQEIGLHLLYSNVFLDGQKVSLSGKDFGQCDLYPTSLEYCPSGRFISVVGDGEYVIYTAIAWRNKTFGKCISLAWSADSSLYVHRANVS